MGTLSVIPSVVEGSLHVGRDNDPAEVKASSPIRTSLIEREGSMRGGLKRPSPRLFPHTFKAICAHIGIPVPLFLRPENINKPVNEVLSQNRVSIIELARSDDSELCHDMLNTYGFTEKQIHRAAERFRLGRSKSGKTIYWMIDDLGRCLDGHIGTASHDADTWVSTLLKRRYPAAAPYLKVKHCLFGLHQILTSPMPIGIVESERSAVLLSELCPELVWMAYSYPSNFMVNILEPLQGRKVTLYPLADPYMDNYLYCLNLADQATRLYHLEISVSRFLEDNATGDQKQRNIDLVDFLFESP